MDEITKMTPDTGKRETIKTPFAKIIVGGTAEKPYYMICYYDPADRQFVVCCGSYNRDFVFQWLAEDFEIIDNGAFDAVPVVRGWWERVDSTHYRWTPSGGTLVDRATYRCSRCGRGTAVKSNYCPNCGAKMDADTQTRRSGRRQNDN